MSVSQSAHDLVISDDATLVARIAAGDALAFESLFRAQFATLCNVAVSYVRAPDAAEDIVQNVFRTLWMRRTDWVVHGALGAYLRAAVRNEALNALRGARRERAATERAGRDAVCAGMGSGPPAIEDAMAAAELSQTVIDVAAALPPRCRTVFLLKWQHGHTYSQIAERLDISIKTVEMQMTRALKRVRARVGDRRD
jgi:RNA polymerase sigma-70 factor (ECF subfamily)